MAWVTAVEASDITNTTVTDAQINAAMSVIEITSNVTEAASANLRASDLRLLKQATAWQAAWMPSQVDFTSRVDMEGVNQDGLQYTPAHSDTYVLAPLAKRSLDKLSWRKSRTIVPAGSVRAMRDWTRESSDDYHSWEPIR